MTARWTDIELLAPENLPVTEQEDDAFRALPWLIAAAEEAAEGEAVQRERDPSGKGLHEPGAKADAGKPLAGEIVLSFPRAMEALIQVASFGAKKYSRGGFLQVEDAEVRYLDAAMRHLLKHGKGEAIDEESGLPHLSAVLWNIAAIIEIRERGNAQEK